MKIEMRVRDKAEGKFVFQSRAEEDEDGTCVDLCCGGHRQELDLCRRAGVVWCGSTVALLLVPTPATDQEEFCDRSENLI
eukprot:COSAG05_NODE_1466_length_4804_cov_1.788523_3_plen_80_part_00